MYKNLEKFIKWLKEVSKEEVNETYINETLQELDNQYCNTGMCIFELSKFETITGNPETYQYELEIEETDDEVIITCIF